jgi:hypothetical protein
VARKLGDHDALVVQPDAETVIRVDDRSTELDEACLDLDDKRADVTPRIVGASRNEDLALRCRESEADLTAREGENGRRNAIVTPRRAVGSDRAPAIFMVTDKLKH